MLHGKIAANKAEQTAKSTFENKLAGDGLPTIKINKEKFDNGFNIIDLVVASNLLSSKGEVRRMIKNKGIKINNITIEDDTIKYFLKYF